MINCYEKGVNFQSNVGLFVWQTDQSPNWSLLYKDKWEPNWREGLIPLRIHTFDFHFTKLIFQTEDVYSTKCILATCRYCLYLSTTSLQHHQTFQAGIPSKCDVFLASQDALEVMGVSHWVSHWVLVSRLYWCDPDEEDEE